jgi:lysophospholipid acyltransferase (LPLAT)-like uncharacterized protein
MKYRLLSFLFYWFARAIFRTMRLQVRGEDEAIRDLKAAGKGWIIVTWHGRSFIPVNWYRNRGYWSMVSTSRDGEYQDWFFRRLGFKTVRGSTSARGAVQATLTMVRNLKAGGVLAFAPDGPRGPRGQCQPGAVYLARKSGCPVIPIGVSANPRKLVRSWDQYLVPKPFCRAAIVYGKPIYVPDGAKSDEAQAKWAAIVGAELDRVENEAEKLVGGSKQTTPERMNAEQLRQA